MNFGKALPDLDGPRLFSVRVFVDVVCPDPAENEGPDADEDVDEHLHGRRRAEDPAGLIVHPLGGGLGENQRLGDAAAGDSRAIGLDGEPHPRARDQRLVRQKGLRQERQDEDFDNGENHDERGDEDRHRRPRADRAARRDRRRDAADRDARRKRHGVFAAEAEPLAGHEIHDCPIDEVGLDDGGSAANEQRTCEIELARRGHGEERAEDHDGDLDVKFGPDRLLEPVREAREDVGDDQARNERDDETAPHS